MVNLHPINSTQYAKLYPQNGERIVTIDSVTSFHLMYTAPKTRATCCFTRIMLYAEVDAQCDKMAKYCQLSSTDDGHQFVTPTVHLCRTKLTTLSDDPRACPAKFCKSGV